MKSLTTLAFAAGLAWAAPCHATTYAFDGYLTQTPEGQGLESASFALRLDGPVTADRTVGAADMISCAAAAHVCAQAMFYVDAAAAGLAYGHHDWQAIALQAGPITGYFYFETPAFTADGPHVAVEGAGPARLAVSSVPEPSPLALAALGLPLAWIARRRPARQT